MIDLARRGTAASSSYSQVKRATGTASQAVAAQDQEAGQQHAQGVVSGVVEQDPSTSMLSLPISIRHTIAGLHYVLHAPTGSTLLLSADVSCVSYSFRMFWD